MTEVKRLISQYWQHSYDAKNQYMLDAIEAADYYFCRKPDSAVTGGSRAVSPVVKTKVDDAAIQIMDIISKLKEGTKVKSKNPNIDILESDKVKILNLIENTMWGNQLGNKALSAAVRDSLICGTSALRWFVDVEEINSVNNVHQIDEIQLELLKAQVEATPNQSYVILEEYKDKDLPEGENKMFDVQITTTDERKVVRYKNVPFNDLMVEPNARSIRDAKYVGIQSIATKASLIAQGFPEDLVMMASTEDAWYTPAQVDNGIDYLPSWRLGTEYTDKKASEVVVWEHFFYTNLIDKKATKLYKAVMVGSTILDITPEDEIPAAEIIPVPNIDVFWGGSYASMLKTQQDIKTMSLRGWVDNVHNANHGRVIAMKGQYNKRDLMDNRPRGVVEIDVPGAIQPYPYQPLPQGLDGLMAIMDKDADDISGISPEMLGRGDAIWNSNVAASTTALNYSKGDLTIKYYTTGIILGIQALAMGLYNEWTKLITDDPLPVVSAFHMTFETEAGRRGKAMNAFQTYQAVSQTKYMTPEFEEYLIKEYLVNSSMGCAIEYLKTAEQVRREMAQPNPAQQLQQSMLQAQVENLNSQTKMNMVKADIEAETAASEQNREDAKLNFEMEKSAAEMNIKDRAQTNEELKTAIEAEQAQMELQSKNLALVYEAKYKDLFNANEIVR